MSGDVNDAIQSLSRIAQASARLMAELHRDRHFPLSDRNEELPHIRANLDRIEALFGEAGRG